MERSLMSMDVATRAMTEVAAKSMISGYRARQDVLLVNEDIGKKTDYDTLGAGEARVDLVGGGARRAVIASTKGLNLISSRDLRSYAYTKQGGIYFASIDDKEARFLAGSKKDDSKKEDEKKP